jgi:hypothetical protein
MIAEKHPPFKGSIVDSTGLWACLEFSGPLPQRIASSYTTSQQRRGRLPQNKLSALSRDFLSVSAELKRAMSQPNSNGDLS